MSGSIARDVGLVVGGALRTYGRLAVVLAYVTVLCWLPTVLLAQSPDNGPPPQPFDSPLTAPTLLVTPLPTATATPVPTVTPTAAPTATPTPTPTPDLATAVLQVSPLRVAPDARPIAGAGALGWITAALLLVLAGALVMTVSQRNK